MAIASSSLAWSRDKRSERRQSRKDGEVPRKHVAELVERLGWNIAKQEIHQSHRQKHKQKKRAEASLDDLCGVDLCIVPIARDDDDRGDHEPNQAAQGNTPSRGRGNEHSDKVLCSCHNLSLWHMYDFFVYLCQ